MLMNASRAASDSGNDIIGPPVIYCVCPRRGTMAHRNINIAYLQCFVSSDFKMIMKKNKILRILYKNNIEKILNTAWLCGLFVKILRSWLKGNVKQPGAEICTGPSYILF